MISDFLKKILKTSTFVPLIRETITRTDKIKTNL